MELIERLPADAPKTMVDMWEKIYKNAKKQYGDVGKAAAVAWAAVKKKYQKSSDGKWTKKESVTVECIDPKICDIFYSEQLIKKLINS